MFLHLGGDYLINQEKIVAILDFQSSLTSGSAENILHNIKDSQKVHYVSEQGKEKSLVVTTDGYYVSPISSTTLLKRSLFLDEKDN